MDQKPNEIDRHHHAIASRAISLGCYVLMMDVFRHADVRGVDQWRWHGTTLIDPAKS